MAPYKSVKIEMDEFSGETRVEVIYRDGRTEVTHDRNRLREIVRDLAGPLADDQ